MAENRKKGRDNPFGGGIGTVEKPKNFKTSFFKLIKYMKRQIPLLLVASACAVLSSIFFVIGPKHMGEATTVIAKGIGEKIAGTGNVDLVKISHIITFVLILYVIGAVFGAIQGVIVSSVTQKVTYNMRKDISEKINRLPLGYFESRTNGEVLSVITNDIDTVGTSLGQSFTQMISSFATIIGVVVMMLTISPLMTLIVGVMIPLAFILINIIVKISQKHFKAQQEYLGNINGMVEENYAGHLVVKAFNKEKKLIKDFNEKNDKMYSSAWKSQFLSGLMQPIMQGIGQLEYVAVAIFGAMMAARGIITIGDIQAFIQYVNNLSQPITQFSQVVNQLQSMIAASERVFEFIEAKEELPVKEENNKLISLSGKVEFENVSFGYDKDKIVLNDVSFVALPTQKVAIVGPTGAGKTTIVKLLMRFYDINSGSIKIDGIDTRTVARSDVRSQFAMVLQDTWLYNDTIMENIRYGRENATDEEVIMAAKAACADKFIMDLKEGYNTILNEEASNISSGQKQLITIARAFLANKKMLILDEATSSVDTRTEMQIQKAMDNLMKGRTSFVIAHRLSTIKDADIILVMNKGDIVEQGSHEELLKKKGFYSELYNSQFEEVV